MDKSTLMRMQTAFDIAAASKREAAIKLRPFVARGSRASCFKLSLRPLAGANPKSRAKQKPHLSLHPCPRKRRAFRQRVSGARSAMKSDMA